MTTPKRNTIARKIRKQPDIQRKFKAYRKLHKDGREGGRHLAAISKRTDLSAGEKLVLHTIGGRHDYRSKIFTSPVTISLSELCEESSQSLSGVRKIIKQLVDRKLLIVSRRKDSYGADCSSQYQLTWKLFKDYIQSKYAKRLEKIAAMPGREPEPDPDGGGNDTETPEPVVPEKSASSETAGPTLRLVYSSTASSVSLWQPGGWGTSFNWLGTVSDAQNEMPACDDSLSEGESAPSESPANEPDTVSNLSDTPTDPKGALSAGEGPISEPLFPNVFPFSIPKALNPNPPISPLAVAKGDFGKGKPSLFTRTKKAKTPYYNALRNHGLCAFAIWQTFADDWKWKQLGVTDFQDVLRTYYPEIIVSLMGKIRAIEGNVRRGKFKGSIDIWIDQLEPEIRKRNAEAEVEQLPALPCLNGDYGLLLKHARMKLNIQAG